MFTLTRRAWERQEARVAVYRRFEDGFTLFLQVAEATGYEALVAAYTNQPALPAHRLTDDDATLLYTSGSTGYISTPDGQSWAVDSLSGGSLSTTQLIQRVEQPSGPWSYQLIVTNSTAPGAHHHLTALRSSSQSVSLTRWEPMEGGIEADLSIVNDGVTSIYSVRLATDADPTDRQTFLGFSGFMGLTPGTESEIRF